MVLIGGRKNEVAAAILTDSSLCVALPAGKLPSQVDCRAARTAGFYWGTQIFFLRCFFFKLILGTVVDFTKSVKLRVE